MNSETSQKVQKTWRTIELGTGLKTASDFYKALTAAGCRVDNLVKVMMSQSTFTVADESRKVELVKISVDELGFPDGAKYSDICQRAQKLGFQLCPAEVGPQLCLLRCRDQNINEWRHIAMEPIAIQNGDLLLFSLTRRSKKVFSLHSNSGADALWKANCCFIFVRQTESPLGTLD